MIEQGTKQIPVCAKDRINYDTLTGAFTWIAHNKHHPRLTGRSAGFTRISRGEKRAVIKINGVTYYASRIAWFLFYGEQPTVIDHINGNPTDNRIENLRNVTQSENSKNHGKTTNGSGFPCGVRSLVSGRFQARITHNKQIVYLGAFDSVDEASAAYKQKREHLFGEFNRRI